jgi:LiaI-LiaF-like transmembrane region
MTDQIGARCSCARCRMHSLMGPVIIITIGVIFLLSEYTPYGIGHLWPLILIVVGIFRLAESMVSSAGHTGS